MKPVFIFSQLTWLGTDFNNWKDWEDDSDEEMGKFDQLSDVSTFVTISLDGVTLAWVINWFSEVNICGLIIDDEQHGWWR